MDDSHLRSPTSNCDAASDHHIVDADSGDIEDEAKSELHSKQCQAEQWLKAMT